MMVSYLANNTDAPLVLIEAGGVSPHDDNPRFFDVLADLALTTQEGNVLQARVLGGGSAINGMLLTGDEPDFARGLTRLATEDDIGMMGRFLLAEGGRLCRLWWNGGRWNPGRAVQHLEEEGRISIIRDEVASLEIVNAQVTAVHTTNRDLASSRVVLCAGALVTPRILMNSQLMPQADVVAQNHHSISVVVRLTEANSAPFDTAVVKEIRLPSGEIFMVNAYERVSAEVPDHALMTVSHMNPANGVIDASATQVARELAESLAASLRGVRGVANVEVREDVVPLAHVSSTCIHVTDGNGRIKGVRGVWAADASVLPHVPFVTPAAPVTMEALRIARIIAGELS